MRKEERPSRIEQPAGNDNTRGTTNSAPVPEVDATADTRQSHASLYASVLAGINGENTLSDAHRVAERISELGGYAQPRGKQGEWRIQCPHPDHPDLNPSASLTAGEQGKALIHCFTCPDTNAPEWIKAVTIRLETGQQFTPAKPRSTSSTTSLTPKTIIAEYTYLDTNGREYQKIRYEPKSFSWRRSYAGNWVDALGRTPLESLKPYGHQYLTETDTTVYWVEGEKDVETARTQGIPALTSAGGASGQPPADLSCLRARNVVIVADRDEPGIRYAHRIAEALKPIAANVQLAQPRSNYKGADLSDHLNDGYSIQELDYGPETQPDAEPETQPDAEPETSHEESTENQIKQQFPILDWESLWEEDDPGEEWIAEPLIAKRRGISLYSIAKAGKSLLLLEIAASIANGDPIFGYPANDPRVVLYVDFENDPRGDVRARLKAMGRTPDQIRNLKYLSFPSLSALDTREGGKQLIAVALAYNADVVIIDTASRVIEGKENENDTWLAFYRHTGQRLKQHGIAYIRLDHAGKDHSRGARGGSAKSGDVDAIWQLRADGDIVVLECDDSRFPIAEKRLAMRRETTPTLRHVVDPGILSRRRNEAVQAAIHDLNRLHIDPNTGSRKATSLLKEQGLTHSNRIVQAAQEARREQAIQLPIIEAGEA